MRRWVANIQRVIENQSLWQKLNSLDDPLNCHVGHLQRSGTLKIQKLISSNYLKHNRVNAKWCLCHKEQILSVKCRVSNASNF